LEVLPTEDGFYPMRVDASARHALMAVGV
jgi:hypothetical protein